MNKEQQRIKIAEACGYIRDEASDCWRKDGLCYFVEDPHHLKQLPDCLKDLNAMHEAEKTLREMQTIAFIDRLGEIVDQGGIVGSYGEIWNMLSATAAQRAEAFLRTLNLWEE